MSKQDKVKDKLQKLGCIEADTVLKSLNKDIKSWNPSVVPVNQFASHLIAKYSLNKID